MKKLLKTGLVVLLFGLFFGLMGLWQNGFKPLVIVHGQPQVVTYGKFQKQVAAFDSINVNSRDYLIRIKQGSDYHVKVAGKEQTLPKVKVQNKTLTITQPNKDNHYMTFDMGNTTYPTIWITVPKGVTLTAIQSKNDSGVSLEHIKTQQLTIDANNSNVRVDDTTVLKATSVYSASGTISMTNTKLQDPQLKAQNGDITLKNTTLTQGTLKSSSGDINLSDIMFTGIVKVDARNGDVRVSDAPRDKGYRLKTDTGTNRLFNQSSDDGDDDQTQPEVMTQNAEAADRIEIVNGTGDNTVW